MRLAFDQILDDYADRPWMDASLRHGAASRVAWDDLRAAQREGRWSDAVGQGRRLARHPAAVRALAAVLAQRRRARRRARGGVSRQAVQTGAVDAPGAVAVPGFP